MGGTLDSPSVQPINIKCLSTFGQDQTVTVNAKKKHGDAAPVPSWGSPVVANAKSNRRIQNVMLVTINTPALPGTASADGALKPGEKDFFVNMLRQALVDPAMTGDVIDLDISADTTFAGLYTQMDTVANAQTVILSGGANNVVTYLQQKLAAQLTAAGDAGRPMSTIPPTKSLITGGFRSAASILPRPSCAAYGGLQLGGTNTFMMSPNRYTNCLAHEMLHSLGLPHTFVPMQFSGNALFTYKYGMTDNIMDYSNNANGAAYQMAGNCLYKWQWFIAQNNSTPEP